MRWLAKPTQKETDRRLNDELYDRTRERTDRYREALARAGALKAEADVMRRTGGGR